MLTRDMAPTHHLGPTLGLMFVLSGCSVLFPFRECETDADCTAAVCVDGVCRPQVVADTGPPDAAPTTEVVRGPISTDTVWSGVIVMEGSVEVTDGTELRIAPGTTVLGRLGSSLVVRPDGILYADGTADEPIVFTSGEAPRDAGDWGGVALLGDAPVNGGTGILEGFPLGDIQYGGDDPRSNCGVLRYVRIEFAGKVAGQDQELNGLTLAGCGTDTIVDYVQVHRGLDDGVEIFGGTVDLAHIVVSEALDDGLDFDLGWQGSLRHLAILQRLPGDAMSATSAIEASARPESGEPGARVFNVTVLGCADCTGGVDNGQNVALRLKEGLGARLENLLVVDPLDAVIRVEDSNTRMTLDAGHLRLGPSRFELGDDDVLALDPNGADLAAWLESLDPDDETPSLPPTENGPLIIGDMPADLDMPGAADGPGWRPPRVVALGVGASDEGDARLGEPAPYLGAFDPDRPPWTDGWTAYPRE